jgi:hypothetical protein
MRQEVVVYNLNRHYLDNTPGSGYGFAQGWSNRFQEVPASLSVGAIRTLRHGLGLIVLNVEWMRSLRDTGELDSGTWMYFAASDTISFLTSVRSLFDHLALTLKSSSPSPA